MNTVFRLFSAVLLLMPLIGNASSWTGKTTTIRYGAGLSPARVSILVGAHGSPCPTHPTWFAFEDASAGTVSIWASALLQAQTAGFVKSL